MDKINYIKESQYFPGSSKITHFLFCYFFLEKLLLSEYKIDILYGFKKSQILHTLLRHIFYLLWIAIRIIKNITVSVWSLEIK